MMITSRNIGQTLCVGDDIEVTILNVTGRQVRIGIKAPREVLIDRKEVRERKLAEKAVQS